MPGRFRHAVVTLTGTSNSLNLGTLIQATGKAMADDYVIQCDVQPAAANAAVVYIGGAGAGPVTTSDYGIRLEIPITSVPQAPYKLLGDRSDSRAQLSDWVITGANTEKVSVLFQLSM